MNECLVCFSRGFNPTFRTFNLIFLKGLDVITEMLP